MKSTRYVEIISKLFNNGPEFSSLKAIFCDKSIGNDKMQGLLTLCGKQTKPLRPLCLCGKLLQ